MTDTPAPPPFPENHRRPPVVWDDIDRLGMPREVFAWEAPYLRTNSTGMLHAPFRWTQCVRAATTEVGVPLVSDAPDPAERCSKCAHHAERPPEPVARAYDVAAGLKWWEDYVTALEARVATMDREGLLHHRRRGPVRIVVAEVVDARVATAACRTVDELEARRSLALAKMSRRLRDDTADIDRLLDQLVVDVACDTARAEARQSFRNDVWPLVASVEPGRPADAPAVWDAAEQEWRDNLGSSAEDRTHALDAALARFAEPPVVNLSHLRGDDLLVAWSGFDSPAAWADAEFTARRRRLAEKWTGMLDAALAEARKLRREPDHYLVTTNWDEHGPTRIDELRAVLPAFPHVTAEIAEGLPWNSRAEIAALVRAPAVLARRLHDSWSTIDAGPARADLDPPTLRRLLTDIIPGGDA